MRPGTARIAESVAPKTTAPAYKPPARLDRDGALKGEGAARISRQARHRAGFLFSGQRRTALRAETKGNPLKPRGVKEVDVSWRTMISSTMAGRLARDLCRRAKRALGK